MVAAWALRQVVFATRDAAPSASDEFRRHPHAAVRVFRVPLLPTLVHPPGIVTPGVQQHCKCAAVFPIQPQDLPGGGLQVHEAAFHSQMELVHQTVQIEDQATRLSSTLQDHLLASGSVRANSPKQSEAAAALVTFAASPAREVAVEAVAVAAVFVAAVGQVVAVVEGHALVA